MFSQHITAEQTALMLEFMEKNGDIGNNSVTSNPHGRVQRERLWRDLVSMLDQAELGPKKSIDKWMKTWADLKHRTKKKIVTQKADNAANGGSPNRITLYLSEIENRVYNVMGKRNIFGGPTKDTRSNLISEPAVESEVEPVENDSQSSTQHVPLIKTERTQDVETARIEQIYILDEDFNGFKEENSHLPPTPQLRPSRIQNDGNAETPVVDNQGTSNNMNDNMNRKRIRKIHPNNYFKAAVDAFAQIEEKRLKMDDKISQRQYDIELKRLELDTLRERNFHERELQRAQIEKDHVQVQQKILAVLLDIKNKN